MNDLMTINAKSCKKCSFCVEVCPNKIIKKDVAGKIVFDENRVHLCMGCGQCMAVCPTSSVNINGLTYGLDFRDLPKKALSPESFFDIMVSRRAVRNYKDKPVPKNLLEKIAEAIAMAPPSFPPLKTEIVIVQDTAIIRKSLPYMIELYDGLLKAIENPIARFVIKQKIGREKFLTVMNHIVPLMKYNLPALKNGTVDTITRNAQAMIIFHANKNTENYKQDIYISLTYGFLAAHALGLGACPMDIIPPAIERNKELRKLFCIPDSNEVVAS